MVENKSGPVLVNDIEWVVVDGEKNVGEEVFDFTPFNWHVVEKMPLAYDSDADVRRFSDLLGRFGKEEARRILSEEMEDDITFHFLELGSDENRVKLYEYEYKIGEDGRLRESVGENDLVEKMFSGQEGEVVGGLWMSHIIPFLEDAEVGQSVFTLSVKSEDMFEGAYDFSYMMIKTSENTVDCMGLELDLSKNEEREIINRQLRVSGAPEKVLLSEDFDWRKGRGRAVMYEKNEYRSLDEMFLSIVGNALNEMRGVYELGNKDKLENFLKEQREREINVRRGIGNLVKRMIDNLVVGERLDGLLQEAQVSYLIENDYELYREGMEKGYVVLACGIVNLNNSMGFSVEDNLEKKWEYHNGTCIRCKSSGVEVGPCEICKKCEVELEKE